MTNTGGLSGDILRSYFERIERLEIDRKAIGEDILEVFAEAKSAGFDNKIMRKVLSIRKMESHERQEQEALLDMYLHAVEGSATGVTAPNYTMTKKANGASYQSHKDLGWTDEQLLEHDLMVRS